MKMAHAFLATTIGILLLSEDSLPQWSNDASQNLKVAGGGINPEICIDGNGGCFIVWETGTSGNRRLLRMQHLNRYGYKSFPESGISLASEEFDQSTPFFLTYGGEGTAIVLFYDGHIANGQLMTRTLVQRVDSTGTRLWGDTAVRVAQTNLAQNPTALLADGKGGAFVFWAEDRNGDSVLEMFGNCVAANGQLLWEQNGKKFADYAFNYTRTQVATDGFDGLFSAFTQSTGIVIQRINNNGEFLWPAAIPMSVGIWGVLTSDNSGGFFWTAHEQISYRPPAGPIYQTSVFRYNDDGTSLWPVKGIAITDSAYGQTFSPEVLVNDHQDVTVIYRALSGAFDNIYVQRINFDGELLFEYGGRPVSPYSSIKALNQSTLGMNENIFVVWWDGRINKGDLYGQVFAQKANFNSDVAVSTRPEVQWNHRACSDNDGGSIIAWYEIGLGSGWGIFAQQVNRDGKLGAVVKTSVDLSRPNQKIAITPLTISLFPNPFSDTIRLQLVIAEIHPIVIYIFDLTGKIVKEWRSDSQGEVALKFRWDGRSQDGKLLPSGIYIIKVQAGNHVASKKIIFIR